jgi:hypothetical protein
MQVDDLHNSAAAVRATRSARFSPWRSMLIAFGNDWNADNRLSRRINLRLKFCD